MTSSDVASPLELRPGNGNLKEPFGFNAALLVASPIRSSGVQDFSVASPGPRNLPIEATSPNVLHYLRSRCRFEAAHLSPPATRETMAPAMSASSVRAGCGLRAAGSAVDSVPSLGGPPYATQASLSLCSVVVSVVVYDAAQRAPIIALPAEKIVTPCRQARDTLVASAPPTRSNCSLGPLTQRGIMNFKLTSWLLSFALAVLLFGIVSIALFDRMHASL